MEFNPNRFSTARKRLMLNKKALAEQLGVTVHTISRWENYQTVPTTENVEAITRALGYPRPFFFGPNIDEATREITSFRSQKSMSAAQRDAALSAGQVGFLISDWVAERFTLPALSLPDLGGLRPDTAARALREEWGLGEKPVSNMLQLMEAKGVRVFSLAENTSSVNAYSLWRKNMPYAFLNNFKSAECSRFDAAHELAHLVLHQDGEVVGREAEDQADRFASAFLMPAADVVAMLPRVVCLPQIISAKRRWKVSAAALNYRLHQLGITSEWRNRDLCIEIAKRGYHRQEPEGIEREKSGVWGQVLQSLWLEKVTLPDIARDLHLPQREVSDLLFGLITPEWPSVQVPLALHEFQC